MESHDEIIEVNENDNSIPAEPEIAFDKQVKSDSGRRKINTKKEKDKEKVQTKSKPKSFSKNQTDKEQSRVVFAKQLAAGHKILAVFLKSPELVLTDGEAESLAERIVDIIDYYDLAISRGLMLWSHLIFTSSMIYGPRLAMISARRKKQAGSNAVEDISKASGLPIS